MSKPPSKAPRARPRKDAEPLPVWKMIRVTTENGEAKQYRVAEKEADEFSEAYVNACGDAVAFNHTLGRAFVTPTAAMVEIEDFAGEA